MQEEYYDQQPQQQMNNYPMQPPMMYGAMSEGTLQYQLDSNELIDEIEHIIKGERPQIEGNNVRWFKITHLINEKGVNSVIMILKSRLTKVFILSDLEEEHIQNMTISVGQTLIDDLYYNWEKYEIPNPSSASMIISLVTDAVFATLRKAKAGNYMLLLKTTERIHEVQNYSQGIPQTNMNQQSGRRGFLDNLMRFGQGK